MSDCMEQIMGWLRVIKLFAALKRQVKKKKKKISEISENFH